MEVEMQSKVLEFDNRIQAVMIEYRDKLNQEEAYQGLALMLGQSLARLVPRMKEEGQTPAEIHAAIDKVVDAALVEAGKE